MMEQRDALIAGLFERAAEELPATRFVTEVMVETDRKRRRQGLVWALISLTVLLVFGVLVVALGDTVALLTRSLNLSLFSINNEVMAQLVSPVNSLGFLLALGFLAVRKLLRMVRS